MAFRIQAKNFSLTYSQANNITKEELFNCLKTFLPEHLIVAQEEHQDGGRHFHVSISFSTRKNITNSRFFDCNGAHANIQATRCLRDWLAYLKKEDAEPMEFGEPSLKKRGWSDALGAESKEDFFDILKEVAPRDWVLQQDRIQGFARGKYTKPIEYIPEFNTFTPTANMVRWTNQRKDKHRPKSLVLVGPSRTGKTEWARSLGKHMYWNGMINLDDWDENAEYAIFDDFGWEFMPCKKAFFGAQKTFTLTDKYKRKKTVIWGKPIIFLCNPDEDPFDSMKPSQKAWYDLNMIYSVITKPLFE